ncbi:hypothetical protein JTE90_006367 [Oedothorax gibbosus]|uniref:Uncharacterized protein n=1 Tax=Oedothorax gibbosus TaxID=931172 RepID=A0AAV6VW30_9ARAC|nr:hypothetical protein JTE90_006367 [Oedothorax gibbosus]
MKGRGNIGEMVAKKNQKPPIAEWLLSHSFTVLQYDDFHQAHRKRLAEPVFGPYNCSLPNDFERDRLRSTATACHTQPYQAIERSSLRFLSFEYSILSGGDEKVDATGE